MRATALAKGTARRRALDAALAELDAGHEEPSIEWRREFSLMLGLERLLGDEEPKLADGTVLSAHQVDALSGTLIALTAEVQAAASRNGGRAATGDRLQTEELPSGEVEIEGDEDLADDDEPLDWDAAEEAEEEAASDAAAGRRQLSPPILVRARDRRRQDRRRARLRGGLPDRRRADPHPPAQPRGPVQRRAGRPRLQEACAAAPLLGRDKPANSEGPVTVETYQWFVRNAGKVSDAYTIVICDEAPRARREDIGRDPPVAGPDLRRHDRHGRAHRASRDRTVPHPDVAVRPGAGRPPRRDRSASVRAHPAGVGVRSISKVPLRRGEVDQDFDQEELAALLDQTPFNLAIADLYKTRFRDVPGVVYTAGVRHAHNVAAAFQRAGIKARRSQGNPQARAHPRVGRIRARRDRRALQRAALAEGWNSPRATICMHLAPTASRRIYQQRVGRVTRRQQGKEAGIVVDFVHPATTNDDPVVDAARLLDRDVYRGGAIVVGPLRRGRGGACASSAVCCRYRRRGAPRAGLRARAVANRGGAPLLGRAARVGGARRCARGVEQLAPGQGDAALRRHGELRRRYLITACSATATPSFAYARCSEVGTLRDPEAFDEAVEIVGGWSRDERREGVKVLLQSLAERPIGRRDQASDGSGTWPSTHARCTRSTPSPAGPRPSACSDCS